MYLLSDILTYMRRILKTPSNSVITDSLLIDYVNRFWLNDVDARIQLFDLKTKYQFITQPGVDQYNAPLYSLQTESPSSLSSVINYYPVYQGFTGPVYINGINAGFQTQKTSFFNTWPNVVQQLQAVAVGDGGNNYTFQLPILPDVTPPNPPLNALLRGHVDITGVISSAGPGGLVPHPSDPPIGQTFNTNIPVTSVDSKVFITTLDSNGSNMIIQDSGQFLVGFDGAANVGLLMVPGDAPFGNTACPNDYVVSLAITGITTGNPTVIIVNNALSAGQSVSITAVTGTTELNGNTYTIISATSTTITIDASTSNAYMGGGVVSTIQNFVNYVTGEVNVTFPNNVPEGNNINVQCFYFQSGLPRAILFYNNVLTLRSVPANQYLVELDAFYTPAAYLSTTDSINYAYMSEYIARGAARKILSDTGDWDQFNAYEPLFIEQERLVWKRSQRQWTATRTETIYSQGLERGVQGNTNFSGGML